MNKQNRISKNFLFLDLFGIVVAIMVQSVFRLEVHQNNIFFIFKNYF
jgi:uncharacterized protein (UPF0333 family)